jgi:hypothetical protein
MQMITWSPQLNHAIRTLKKLDSRKYVNASICREFISSFELSSEETQEVRSIMAKNTETKIANNIWF